MFSIIDNNLNQIVGLCDNIEQAVEMLFEDRPDVMIIKDQSEINYDESPKTYALVSESEITEIYTWISTNFNIWMYSDKYDSSVINTWELIKHSEKLLKYKNTEPELELENKTKAPSQPVAETISILSAFNPFW